MEWYKMENNNGFIGFEDDCPRYFVKQDEDGWYWEDSWGFGEGGYDTAEEAMARAEEDLPEASCNEEGFTVQEMEEILACMMAHEKMEMAKLGR